MSEEVKGTDVEVESTELVMPVGYDPKHVDIKPHRLAARVYSFEKGGYAVTDMDAKGIKTVALRLGISVTKSTFVETSNGEGYYFTAKAINLVTKQKATDHCFQPKLMKYDKGYQKKGDFDEDALAKGATRVVRRVRRQLIPEEIIDQAVEFSILGKTTPDAVATAKGEAEQARDRVRLKLKEMGITAKECYEDAQQQLGPAENWGAAEWYAIRDKYLDPEVEFAHLKPQKAPESVAEPVAEPVAEQPPEKTDRQKAIDDIVDAVGSLQKSHVVASELVLTDEGRIREDLIKRWFQTDTKNMDVGQLVDLVKILETFMQGDYGYLPPEERPKQTATAPVESMATGIQTSPGFDKTPKTASQADEVVSDTAEAEETATNEDMTPMDALVAAAHKLAESDDGINLGLNSETILNRIRASKDVISLTMLDEAQLIEIASNLMTVGVDYLHQMDAERNNLPQAEADKAKF